MRRSYRVRAFRRIQITLTPRQKRGMVILGFSLLLLIAALSVNRNLVPIMTEMAVNEANELITASINNAITARLLDGSFSYASLVHLEKDASGNISALTTDMAQINALQAMITNEVLAYVGALGETRMQIPLGNILGGSLLSGRGPGLGFRVVTLGNPSAAFSNEFLTAGINQTKHQIMLDISIQVNILVPGRTTQETISTQMLVAETVIVGEVPSTFGQFHFGY